MFCSLYSALLIPMLGRVSGRDPQAALNALKQAQCVFFDVDSTVIRQEGLDEFAGFLKKSEAVRALTNKSYWECECDV